MKIEISRPLKHVFDYETIELPRSNEPEHEIYSFTGRGDFISALFKFNSDRVFFRVEIDGREVANVNVQLLKTFLGYKDKNLKAESAINYNEGKKLVEVSLGIPVEFSKSIKFFARANSNTSSRDIQGHQITHTTLEDDI